MFFLIPYIAAMFLLHPFPAATDDTVESEDAFKSGQCPAYLVFENAAYLADMTIELPCHCRPSETQSVVWYYQKKGTKAAEVLTGLNGTADPNAESLQSSYDVAGRFSIRMFNLVVFKAQVEDTGNYMCGSGEGDFYYGYSIDIQDSKNAIVEFEDRQDPLQPDMVSKYFVSFTDFWQWTTCDRCDVRGEQRSVGLCYVNSTYLNARYHANLRDVASCGSSAVPPKFKKLLSKRRPEILVRSCTTKCHVAKKGIMDHLTTFMDNIISLKDYFPWQPKVPLQIHTQPIGSRLSIACPGAKPEHAVAWDKDGERLYRTEYLVGVKKSMRVFIDHGNHLNINSIQFNDKGTYYCWLQGTMKAGFKLAVQRDPLKKRQFSDSESIFAMKIIGIGFVFFTLIFILVHCVKCCCYRIRCLPSPEEPKDIDEDGALLP